MAEPSCCPKVEHPPNPCLPSPKRGWRRKQTHTPPQRILSPLHSMTQFPQLQRAGQQSLPVSPGLALEGPGQEKTARQWNNMCAWGGGGVRGRWLSGKPKSPALLGTHTPTPLQPSRATKREQGLRGHMREGDGRARGLEREMGEHSQEEGPGNQRLQEARDREETLRNRCGDGDLTASSRYCPRTPPPPYRNPHRSGCQLRTCRWNPKPPFAPQEAKPSQLRIYWRKCNHIKT